MSTSALLFVGATSFSILVFEQNYAICQKEMIRSSNDLTKEQFPFFLFFYFTQCTLVIIIKLKIMLTQQHISINFFMCFIYSAALKENIFIFSTLYEKEKIMNCNPS